MVLRQPIAPEISPANQRGTVRGAIHTLQQANAGMSGCW
jgi:hypothetical protein